ncbi:hypothetical protein A1O3_09316 [Capronia epimyces CBS 606.96]|uniref:FAD-binding domain-containing protein n=1 Tax=Capronia epimyces CBS 606.96 TaxID=1182542 RepID=W9XLE6_9EURO|nr:uncharacterized protein A1O3_09316 [Capronia epimyces CBS 606.96]EXJ78155.1 hypothetical protein A1O3_09316 [Capronia epimyces CBS 606.96]
MKKAQPFKVVIVGGSVAGLSLANILQEYNIDYVLLEAYPDIAPQVGASIGILPHGNRILDQLGLFQKVLDFVPPVASLIFRNQNGEIIVSHEGMRKTFEERHGYPILFMDRQMLLQALYDNIKDKDKILTGHRVTLLEVNSTGVKVTVGDGTTFEGDIVVGGDGIHSTVRREMKRMQKELSPASVAPEIDRVPCDYCCIFGISNPCKGIEPGQVNSVFRHKVSYLVIGGPYGRVYWFCFVKLPKRLYTSDIPRFTKEDEAQLLAKRTNDKILPNLVFGELFKRKITSNMTALHEHVYEKWYFHRIITIGDAAHKIHPIGGHGGNGAIESAATLANGLLKKLGELRSDGQGKRPTTEEIEAIFRHVQEVRQTRVNHLREYSHEQQRTESMDSPLHWLKVKLLPLMDVDDVVYNFSCNIPLAEKLDGLPCPRQPKLIPFKDDLESDPRPRGTAVSVLLVSFYLACGILTFYGMWVHSASYGLAGKFEAIIQNGHFPIGPEYPLKTSYTGHGWLDNYLTFLTAVFMPGIENWDRNFGTLQRYFLGMLIQPIAVWTVEGFRKRHALTALAPTALLVWFTLFQSAGIGIYMPFYYAVWTPYSDTDRYWWPVNREVPIQYAKVLLPANLLGYVLPTILMFVPWQDATLAQTFEAIWQPGPMLVPILAWLFAAVYRLFNPRSARDHQHHTATEEYQDIAYLKTIYVVIAVLGAALHVYIVGPLLLSSDPSFNFSTVFGLTFTPGPRELGEGLRLLFLADFLGFEAASVAWTCAAIWDLKRVGRTTVNVPKACLAVLAATVLVGPGAAMSIVWYWRETAMAKTQFKSESR